MARQLSDWISGYVEYSEETEPPYSFRLWCAISVIASVLQRKCKVHWGHLTFYPNMYIVLVAPSGKARKGTAMGPPLDLLEGLNINLAAEATTRERLIERLHESMASDPTLDGSLGFHASLTIFSPELTVFLGYENEQLMSDLTDWYDCRNHWKYETKTAGVNHIDGIFVNLIGATTPSLIRDTMSRKAIGGGLTSRMIFVYEEDKGKLCPRPVITDHEKALWQKLQNDLEQIYMMKGSFTLSEDFADYWEEWYIEHHKNPVFREENFSGYMERRPNHVMKLSMILSASRSDKMLVEYQDIKRAVQILEFTEKKMLNTFAGVGKYMHSDTLTRVMNEVAIAGDKGISLNELMFMFRNDANYNIMQEIMFSLKQTGFVKEVTSPNETRYFYKGGDAL